MTFFKQQKDRAEKNTFFDNKIADRTQLTLSKNGTSN